MRSIRLSSIAVRPAYRFWAVLLLITLAELVTALVQPYAGLALHALTLLTLLIEAVCAPTDAARKLALALVLAPLIRLLSLSLPLLNFPRPLWYPLIALPLLLTIWLIARQERISRTQLGLRSGGWLVQLGVAGLGLGLGALQFAILRPSALIGELTWPMLWLPALSLLIATGLTEELIFRGLLQPLAQQVLGRAGLLFVALLAAVLHIGHLSLLNVAVVGAVGLLFAAIVRASGSILGVSLAHGLANIVLLLVLPNLAQQPELRDGALLPWLIGGGSAIGLGATALLVVGGRHRRD